MVVDIRDVITCFKFGDDRFRGLASAEGQILPFPIDFDGRPYNTLTLPCERVISTPPRPLGSVDNISLQKLNNGAVNMATCERILSSQVVSTQYGGRDRQKDRQRDTLRQQYRSDA